MSAEFEQKSALTLKAIEFAQEAHKGQERATGEPYFTHCEEVVKILNDEWGITDEIILSAGYLHDTVEDNPNITLDQIAVNFGPEVARLVDGVSKYRSETSKNTKEETLKKVLITSYLDPRVAVIKLADRLHNMRTLEHLPPQKQEIKAKETLQVYAPLAESLGIWKIKTELEDLAFSFLPNELPFTYHEIAQQINSDPRTDLNFTSYWSSSIKRLLEEAQIEGNVNIKRNGCYFLTKKRAKAAQEGRCSPNSFHSINDVVNVHVTTKNPNECYLILGAIHNKYKNLVNTERLDEFIANPRENGYSALQTTLETPQGSVEIVISTEKMEEFNLWGVISLIKNQTNPETLEQYTLKPIFTPNHKVIFLPKDATGVDFAYAISPELGAGAISLKIGDENAPLSVNLPNASVVEIITNGPRNSPNPELLNFCLPKTQRFIYEQLQREEQIKLTAEGKRIIHTTFTTEKIGIISIIDLPEDILYRLLQNFGCHTQEDLYFKIGGSYLSPNRVLEWLKNHDITKETLCLTTVCVNGQDRPRLLETLSNWIGEQEGNIIKVNLERKDNLFTLNLVISGLNSTAEQEISKKISSDNRFTDHLVV